MAQPATTAERHQRLSAGRLYRQSTARRSALVAVLGGLLAASLTADAAIGPGGFPLVDVLAAVIHRGSRGLAMDVIV